ncbi:Rib/alpha-like domain-containing protein [Streptococcus sp. ZY1909104]|uniref:Rib/alpha-like domain-containing protein n=1 Tax=Streptococcus sp. ZY1909104 TaxID=3233335 RepID=UPI00349F7907
MNYQPRRVRRKQRTERYLRFSIRKFNFGAASVAVAAGMVVFGTPVASAEEIATAANSSEVVAVEQGTGTEEASASDEEADSSLVTVDTSLLSAAVAEAELVDLSTKTADSAAALTSALEAARQVLADSTASQEAVNQATADLSTALSGLVEQVVEETPEAAVAPATTPVVEASQAVDKTALQATIQEATAVDTTTKTAESVANLDASLTEARTVEADQAATQDQVNTATDNLSVALSGLEEAPATEGTTALRTAETVMASTANPAPIANGSEAVIESTDNYYYLSTRMSFHVNTTLDAPAQAGDYVEYNFTNLPVSLLNGQSVLHKGVQIGTISTTITNSERNNSFSTDPAVQQAAQLGGESGVIRVTFTDAIAGLSNVRYTFGVDNVEMATSGSNNPWTLTSTISNEDGVLLSKDTAMPGQPIQDPVLTQASALPLSASYDEASKLIQGGVSYALTQAAEQPLSVGDTITIDIAESSPIRFNKSSSTLSVGALATPKDELLSTLNGNNTYISTNNDAVLRVKSATTTSVVYEVLSLSSQNDMYLVGSVPYILTSTDTIDFNTKTISGAIVTSTINKGNPDEVAITNNTSFNLSGSVTDSSAVEIPKADVYVQYVDEAGTLIPGTTKSLLLDDAKLGTNYTTAGLDAAQYPNYEFVKMADDSAPASGVTGATDLTVTYVYKLITETDKYTPTGQTQTVELNATPDAKASIANSADMPILTRYAYKTPVDTSSTGDKNAIVVVTYPDNTTDEVAVVVKVVDSRKDNEKYTPTATPITTELGMTPNAADGIANKDTLPTGTTYSWKIAPNTDTTGDKLGTVLVTYPDGTTDEVLVPVKVVDSRNQAQIYTPTAQTQTVELNATPDAKASISNSAALPAGTTYAYKTAVNTSTVGDKNAIVVVSYPDGSSEEVAAVVKVVDSRTDAQKYTPTGTNITTGLNSSPNAATAITNASTLPTGTTYSWKTPVDTTQTGTFPATVLVVYPDGTTDEVTVNVTVIDDRTDAQKYTPTGQTQTVGLRETPDAKASIANTADLPAGTTYAYKTAVDTTTTGDKNAIVVVSYPDGTSEEVAVVVKVVSQAQTYTPTGQNLTVARDSSPVAADGIANKDALPEGTTYAWKTPVDTTTTGDKVGTVVVTYPDGTSEEVVITVTVKGVSARPVINKIDTDDLVITGTGVEGATVHVTLPDGTTTDVLVDEEGQWSLPLTSPLAANQTVSATQTEPDKQTSDVRNKVVVDTTADKVAPNDPALTPVADLTNLTPDEKEAVKDAVVAANPDLPAGTRVDVAPDGTVTITYPDQSVDTITPDKTVTQKDTSDAPTVNPVDSDDPVITGTGTPGATIDIALPDGTTVSTVVKPDGTWEAPAPASLEANDPITVTQTEDGKLPSAPATTTVAPTQAEKTDLVAPELTKVDNKYNLTPAEKAAVEAAVREANPDLPAGTTVTVADNGATAVTYPDGSVDNLTPEQTVTPKTAAEKYTPVGAYQEVEKGASVDPAKSILNTADLPAGTTYAFESPVDTTTAGTKAAVVVVTYPDGTSEKVPVTVNVKTPAGQPESQADQYTPTVTGTVTAEKGAELPDAAITDKVDTSTLPEGTTVAVIDKPTTDTPGNYTATVEVTYPDGSKDIVTVPVVITEPATDASKYTPVGQDQSVALNGTPDAKASIANASELPAGTTYSFKLPVDTTTAGAKSATVVVTYPDGSKDEVAVTINVTGDGSSQAEANTPKVTGTVEVAQGAELKDDAILDKVDLTGLPEGTTAAVVSKPATDKAGDYTAVVVVTYPDGSKDEVSVPVKVTETAPIAEGYDVALPAEKLPVDDVNNLTPAERDAVEAAIREANPDLPAGTVIAVDPQGNATLTYPDGSTDTIPGSDLVRPKTAAEKYTPVGAYQEVEKGASVDPAKSILNTADLPAGTTYAFESPVDTTTAGTKAAVVVVTYPDGTSEKVPVTVNVKTPAGQPESQADQYTPTVTGTVTAEKGAELPDSAITDKVDTSTLPEGTTVAVVDKPSTDTPGNYTATVEVTYPDGSKDIVTVPVVITEPATDASKYTPVGQDQSVALNGTPDAKASIANASELPAGTTYSFKLPVDTTTAGAKSATVVVTYPDGSKDEVAVTINVTGDGSSQAETNTPKVTGTVEVAQGAELKDDAILGKVDLTGLPEGTTAAVVSKPATDKAGDYTAVVVVTYPDGSKDEVSVPVKVTETAPIADGYDVALPSEKVPVDDVNNLTPAERDAVEAAIREANPDLPAGTVIAVDPQGNATLTYPDGSTDTIPGSDLVRPKTAAEKYTPVGAYQEVEKGASVDPAKSILNTADLPAGTTYAFESPVDTTTAGTKAAVVVVTYPDGTSEKVPVTVNVKTPAGQPESQADQYTPTVTGTVTAEKGAELPDSAITDKVDTSTLPEGTTVAVISKPSTDTPGNYTATVEVTYPDGSKDIVTVPVVITEPATDASKYTPVGQDQSVALNGTPDAQASIANASELPAGTTYSFKLPVDTTTAGAKSATVVVTYPDGSKDEVAVTINVTGDGSSQAETNTPKVTGTVEVAQGAELKDDAILGKVDLTGLPEGTTAAVVSKPATDKAGDYTAVVVVTYPDGSKDEVSVPVKVTETAPIADGYDVALPSEKVPVDDVNNLTPAERDAVEAAIREANPDLPAGTVIAVDPQGNATLTYPDGSTDTIPGSDLVRPKTAAEKYTPVGAYQEVEKGASVDPAKSILNTADLPAGTTYAFESPVDTTTAGTKAAVVVVTYPDGTSEKVPVTVNVKTPAGQPESQADQYTPTVTGTVTAEKGAELPDSAITDKVDTSTLPEGTTVAVISKPSTDTPGNYTATVEVTYPDGSKDIVTVPVVITEPATDASKYTPVGQDQSVALNGTPDAKASIANASELPAGTTYSFKLPVDTTTAGAKSATVVVTYPDGSKDEVAVTINVTGDGSSQAEANTPKVTGTVEVAQGAELKDDAILDKVDLTGLPEGTTAAVVSKPATDKAGDYTAVVVVTYPDGSKDEVSVPVKVTATTPISDDYDVALPSEKVPVDDVNNLTPAERDAVEAAIREANPDLPAGTVIAVDPQGNATLTYPDGSTDTIPGSDLVRPATDADKTTPVVPTDKVPVGDVNNLTDDEKKAVEDAIKEANPTLPDGTTITVDKDGTATIKYPDGSTDVIPGKDLVRPATDADKTTPVVPTDKVPAKDPNNLTDDEKKAVEDAIKESNPNLPDGTTITVDKDGTATIKYPDGSTDVIPGKDLVRPATDADQTTPVVPTDKVPAKDPNNLTDDEKKAVEDAIKEANPNLPDGTTITVDKDGTATIKYPDGSTDVIPGKDLVRPATDADQTTPVVPTDKVPAKDPNNLTDDEKKAVEDAIKESNPNLPDGTTITVDKDGTATIKYPDGSTDVIPGKDLVRPAGGTSSTSDNSTVASTTTSGTTAGSTTTSASTSSGKVLPNTGEEASSSLISMAAFLLMAAGAAAMVRKREEDEE